MSNKDGRVFVDYGMPDDEKERLGLKWGWMSAASAEDELEKYYKLADQNTERRTAFINIDRAASGRG